MTPVNRGSEESLGRQPVINLQAESFAWQLDCEAVDEYRILYIAWLETKGRMRVTITKE